MALRRLKPTSAGVRGMTMATFDEITTNEPHKPLTEKLVRGSGRNNQGKITVRHRGGEQKRLYRRIDFRRSYAQGRFSPRMRRSRVIRRLIWEADLDYVEDKDAEVDFNIVMTGQGKFVEVQGSGEEATFTQAQLDGLLVLAQKGLKELAALQTAFLTKQLLKL